MGVLLGPHVLPAGTHEELIGHIMCVHWMQNPGAKHKLVCALYCSHRRRCRGYGRGTGDWVLLLLVHRGGALRMASLARQNYFITEGVM